jgi:hypothetical protein
MAVIETNSNAEIIEVVVYPFDTIKDMRNRLTDRIVKTAGMYVVIEHVDSSPQMGVSSAFSFGFNFGLWEGLLIGKNLDFILTAPVTWQSKLGSRTGGDKHVSLKKAMSIYPSTYGLNLQTADAVLIAEYCRRIHLV